jgi:hypothetical protein
MLTLNSARSYVCMITPAESAEGPTDRSRSECNAQLRRDIVRAVRAWTPDYMAYACPFIACCLVGPASMHSCPEGQISRVDRELLLLAVRQFARYWKLGELLIGELSHLDVHDI